MNKIKLIFASLVCACALAAPQDNRTARQGQSKAEAQAAADNAKKWAWYSVAGWVLQIVLVIIYVVFVIGAGAMAGASGY